MRVACVLILLTCVKICTDWRIKTSSTEFATNGRQQIKTKGGAIM